MRNLKKKKIDLTAWAHLDEEALLRERCPKSPHRCAHHLMVKYKILSCSKVKDHDADVGDLWPEWYPEYWVWLREEMMHSRNTSTPEGRYTWSTDVSICWIVDIIKRSIYLVFFFDYFFNYLVQHLWKFCQKVFRVVKLSSPVKRL